jgi:hypothetical protein
MSHSTSIVSLGTSAIAQVTINDYTQGGEQFTLTEFGVTSLVNVHLMNISPLIPRSNGLLPTLNPATGVVTLMSQVATGVECPTTTGLNYTFFCIVQGAVGS